MPAHVRIAGVRRNVVRLGRLVFRQHLRRHLVDGRGLHDVVGPLIGAKLDRHAREQHRIGCAHVVDLDARRLGEQFEQRQPFLLVCRRVADERAFRFRRGEQRRIEPGPRSERPLRSGWRGSKSRNKRKNEAQQSHAPPGAFRIASHLVLPWRRPSMATLGLGASETCSVGRRRADPRMQFARLFRRLDCARVKHISCPIIDKRASVPDDAGAAAGEPLVNTATAAPAEAMAAKTADRLIDVRVSATRYAARDTNIYEFAPLDGKPLPPYEPGAHIDLHLPNGLIRQYSLIRPEPDPSSYAVTVKRDPASRGGSRYVHDELRVGRTLKISAPRNNFPLVENASHVVLLAGGIGITPIWCMVQRLQKLDRSWKLYYACRSRADMAFLQALEAMGRAQFHFDDESAGNVLDVKAIVAEAPKDAHLYCCGPTPMLKAFEAATADWPRARIHVEYFTPKQAADKKGGFVVELARSGQEFVIPEGKSILQVLLDAGVDVDYSCELGICGACEQRVISGTPEHRDAILTEEEQASNTKVMICCAGCKSERLVLDL